MRFTVLTAVAFVAAVNAQTWSACNPMLRTDCPKNKALACSYNYSYKDTQGEASDFSFGNSGQMKYEDGVAKFRINKSLDAPTIASNFYIMYGKVDVRMKAAPGAGIVSSLVLQSDTLDEIDWEWLGGDVVQGQSNYFGKGNTTVYDRGAYHPMNHQEFHTYGVEWTETQLHWILDGTVVRTLNKADVKYDQYPQTPMQIKIGSWAGGDASNNAPGVVDWAGGPTDFKKGPFDMIVESISIVDYSSGNFYKYSDKTGSSKSIKSEGGQVNAGPQLNACGQAPVASLPSSTATTSSTTSTAAATSKTEEEKKATKTEAPKETKTEEPVEETEAPEPVEEEEPATTAPSAPFPTLEAPFGNNTINGTAPGGTDKPVQVKPPVKLPVDEEKDEDSETPAEEDSEAPVEEDKEETEEGASPVVEAPFPESTTTTTTLTQIQTVTTCLAVTTTDAAGHEVTTSSTATLTRTETLKTVVTVPCETATITAPGGAVVTTVVPGTIVITPTPVPSVPEVPSGETPEVPSVPEVPAGETPSVETPEVPEVPSVDIPEVPEVPSVETPEVPEVPSVEIPEVPEVPSGETPSVETPEVPAGETPSTETPEVPAGETPSGETPEVPSGVKPVPTEPEVAQPSKIQTYTTVTLTSCATVCGSASTGLPPAPINNGTNVPVFNGTTSFPPVTEETELETPETPEENNVPGTVIESPLEFDGAATSLKGSLAGVVVAGVLGFLVL